MGRGSTCERARYWAALAPDGELSGMEQRLLDAHLARCAECAAFAADVMGATEALRAAPYEEAPFRVRVPAPSRRRARRAPAVTAGIGVAAAIAAAAAIPLRGDFNGPEPIARPAIVIDATTVEGDAEQRRFLTELRDYRNAQTALESELGRERRPGFDAG